MNCRARSRHPKERCTTTMNLVSGDEAVAADVEDVETETLMQ